MKQLINAKTLRRDLGRILERVRRGQRFTVLYRNRPVCDLVPPGSADLDLGDPTGDPLYRMPALGRSSDGLCAADHDEALYPRR